MKLYYVLCIRALPRVIVFTLLFFHSTKQLDLIYGAWFYYILIFDFFILENFYLYRDYMGRISN